MIETVYHGEEMEDAKIRLPKNIYQIGSGNTKYHIYIEDKVSEYLDLVPEHHHDIRYGVLLGDVKFSKNEMYMFIRAVVEVRDVIDNTILFGDEIWTSIHDQIKKYYFGEKIIGWFSSKDEFEERELFHIQKIHLDHFAGNDKVYLSINREEQEKDFYIYVAGDMVKINCYHIYYEKNPDLEKYIFETHYNLESPRKSIRTRAEKLEQSTGKEKGEEIDGEMVALEPKIDKVSDQMQKEIKYTKRGNKILSYCAMATLLVVAGSMYQKGQFDNLATEMRSVVAGIMNQSDVSDLDDVVLLQDDKVIETTTEQETESATKAVVSEQVQTIEKTTKKKAQEKKTEVPKKEKESATAAVLPAQTDFYKVKKGDTLFGICQKLYGNADNMEVIMELNGLDSADNIQYGKSLIVPGKR